MRLPSRARALAVSGVILVLSLSTGLASAAVYNPPHAEVFSWDYPSGSPGNSLGTRYSGTNAWNQLKATGYTAYDFTNTSASTSVSSSYGQSDAVWAHFGHARPGASLFYTSSGGYSELRADGGVSSYGWPQTSLVSTPGLNDIRLMVFAGCNTAQSAHPGDWAPYGNLMTAAQQIGVDSVLGFSGTIYWPNMNWWATMFFQKLREGNSLSASASSAAGYVLYATGIYAGTDTYSVHNGTVKITPAAYGS